MNLTDAKIKALRPKAQRYEIFEGRGFGIRVSPKGTKTFVCFYRFNGRQRRMTLGEYGTTPPRLTLADAHREHATALKQLEDGIDPAASKLKARDDRRRAPTVKQLAKEYIERWAKPKKASWEEDERVLNKDVIPLLGHLKAQDVRRRDIISVLDAITDRGAPIAANRAAALLSRVFNFAIDRGILDASPCVRLHTHKEAPRKRVLTDEEIRTLWHALPGADMSERVRVALRLILVTGQRPGEVCGMAENELDGTWWTIPVGRLKTRHRVHADHRVPLTPLALELIEAARKAPLRNSKVGHRRRTEPSPSEFLFPAPSRKKPMQEAALSRALRRNLQAMGLEHFTPHDLRRTVRTRMAELGVSEVIAERVMGHSLQGMAKVYNQHEYAAEKRAALEAWEAGLRTILGSNGNEEGLSG